MDGTSSFADVQSSIQTALVTTTRTTNQLASEDLAFHRSLDRNVAVSLDKQNVRLLALAERLLHNAAEGLEVDNLRLRDADSVDSNWRSVVDVIDNLLEKTDTTLDEFTGAVKRLTPREEQSPAPTSARTPKSKNLYRNQDLVKPQLSFEHTPQNHDTTPFKPLLTYKPHASVPLEDCMHTFTNKSGYEQYPHPYQTEIENYAFPAKVYTKAEPIQPQPLDTTTAIMVDTPEAVATMLEELKNATEIAIDLEHHDTRSYIGIVSLMQITTREKDWIVDTLRPWRRKLECLNEVFTDPSIVKVLHGAYMDAIWLQRDLGLYLVGLFDTYWASRTLGYTGHSLAFLLEKFVNFKAQKQYQMADWRIRPLPQDLFDYARSDTHFLLYIYDNMRNELVDRSDFSDSEKDKVLYVLENSKETALQRYETPIYEPVKGRGPVGWYRLISKTPTQLDKEQFAVYRAVHQWRDSVAREEDESPTYILRNNSLFNIAKQMPKERPSLLNLSSPLSQTLRLRVDELLAVISKAKAEGADGPALVEVLSEDINRNDASTTSAIKFATQPAEEDSHETHSTLYDSIIPVKSGQSKFWGSTFSSSIWEPQPRVSLTLALPLPPLTASIFADPADISGTDTASQPIPPPEHTFIKKDERPVEDDDNDGIFVIKQLGGLRKRKLEATANAEADAYIQEQEDAAAAGEDGLRTGADEISLTQAQATTKAEKKAAKRAKKQQKKQVSSQAHELEEEEHGDKEEEEEEAFDYDNAPSVLNSLREEEAAARAAGGRRKKTKPAGFNPYKKAMDAPKGLKKVQQGGPGRSATFAK